MIDGYFEDVVKERNDLLLRLAAAEELAEKVQAECLRSLRMLHEATAERDRLREEVEEARWLVENADLMAFHPFHPGRSEYSKRRDAFLGRQQHGKAT